MFLRGGGCRKAPHRGGGERGTWGAGFGARGSRRFPSGGARGPRRTSSPEPPAPAGSPSPLPPLPPPPPWQSCRSYSGDAGSSGSPLPPHFPQRAGRGPGRLRREKKGNRARGRWRSSGTHGCGQWVGQRISSMTTPDLRQLPPVPLLQPPPLVPGWGGGSLSP